MLTLKIITKSLSNIIKNLYFPLIKKNIFYVIFWYKVTVWEKARVTAVDGGIGY